MLACLCRKGVALDLSDTGTGKTYVAAALFAYLGLTKKDLLLVVPKSSIPNWMEVCRSAGVKLDSDTVITHQILSRLVNYKDKSLKYKDKIGLIDSFFKGKKLVLVDEAHCLRNYTSNISKTMSLARKGCNINLLMLSATLIEVPENMISMIAMLYKRKNECRGGFTSRQWFNSQTIQGLKSLSRSDYFHKVRNKGRDVGAMKSFFVDISSRMRNADFGLTDGFRVKPKVYKWESVSLIANEKLQILKAGIRKQIYNFTKSTNDLNKEYGLKIDKCSVPSEQIRLRKELKACLWNKKKESFSEEMRLKIAYQKAVEIARVDNLMKEVVTYLDAECSVCVFVNYVDSLLASKAFCEKRRVKHSIIMGGQSGKERQQNIDDFQSDKNNVILLTITSGSNSISLHADEEWKRRRISIVCPTYNATSFKQALGRTNRVNRTSEALVIMAFVDTPIERDMARATKEKVRNIESLNDDDFSLNNIKI